MKVTYEYRFVRQCPVNDGSDIYDLTVEAEKRFNVEDILAAIERLPVREYQEEITVLLAKYLPGCRIVVTGYHSGVKTTCLA